MSVQEWFTYGVVFLAVVMCVWLVSGKRGEQGEAVGAKETAALPGVFRMMWPLLSALEKTGLGVSLMPSGSVKTMRMAQWIMTARLEPLTPKVVGVAQVVYGLVFAVFVAVLPLSLGKPEWSVLAALLGLFMGWVTPATVVEGAADRRRTEMLRKLPFAIDLIGAAMRAGSAFGDAVRFYVSQSQGSGGALAEEFKRLLARVQYGIALPEALDEMARRVDAKEFSGFTAAVSHSLETGAALVDTLNIQGAEMRRVRFNIAEQKAQRAPSLMILPIALFIMPAVFIVVFTPVYLQVKASGMSGMMAK